MVLNFLMVVKRKKERRRRREEEKKRGKEGEKRDRDLTCPQNRKHLPSGPLQRMLTSACSQGLMGTG